MANNLAFTNPGTPPWQMGNVSCSVVARAPSPSGEHVIVGTEPPPFQLAPMTVAVGVGDISGGLVFDGFEAGDKSVHQTNVIDFIWSSGSSVNGAGHIVTMEGGTVAKVLREGNNAVPADPYALGAGRDWTAKAGSNCMLVRYSAGGSSSEQRFITSQYLDDFWMSYWVRVPVNFYCPRDPVTYAHDNAKWLALWPDNYDSTNGGTCTWEYRPNYGLADGSCYIYLHDGGAISSDQQPAQFLVPADGGRWMHMVHRVKAPSAEGASDGLIQLYRMWEGESGHTLLHQKTNASKAGREPGAGGVGIRRGFMFGWVNEPFSAITEWLVDDVKISSAPLVAEVV